MLNKKPPEPPIKTFAALSFDVKSFAVVKATCKPGIRNIWTIESEVFSNNLEAENKFFSYGLVAEALQSLEIPKRSEILTTIPNLDKKIGDYKIKRIELDLSTAIADALSLIATKELIFSSGLETLQQELENFSIEDEKHSHRVISLFLAISQPVKVNWLFYS